MPNWFDYTDAMNLRDRLEDAVQDAHSVSGDVRIGISADGSVTLEARREAYQEGEGDA